MTASAESGLSNFDTAKLIIAIALLLIGVVGYHYLLDISSLYRILGVIGASLVAIGIMVTTALGRTFLAFLKESRVEVRKVVWPTRQETTQATLIVLALVFLVGIVLWLLDMFLFWGVSLVTGQGA